MDLLYYYHLCVAMQVIVNGFHCDSAHNCNTFSLVTTVSLLSSCGNSSIIAAKSLCLSLQLFFVLPCRISSIISATILRSSLLLPLTLKMTIGCYFRHSPLSQLCLLYSNVYDYQSVNSVATRHLPLQQLLSDMQQSY